MEFERNITSKWQNLLSLYLLSSLENRSCVRVIFCTAPVFHSAPLRIRNGGGRRIGASPGFLPQPGWTSSRAAIKGEPRSKTSSKLRPSRSTSSIVQCYEMIMTVCVRYLYNDYYDPIWGVVLSSRSFYLIHHVTTRQASSFVLLADSFSGAIECVCVCHWKGTQSRLSAPIVDSQMNCLLVCFLSTSLW